jgi:chemotaxis protein MotC
VRAAQRIASGVLGCALILSAAAKADDADLSPVRLMNALQSAQSEIAQGNLAAYAAQPKMLREIAEALSAAKPEVWQNPRNARAAVIYVLSGGQPRILARLLESGNFPKGDENLLRGALAYALGRQAEAQKLLADIDAKSLDLPLAGQVAFVQSILVTGTDVKKAIGLLDLARLLMPGGLVEEAALRREVFVEGDVAHDADRFMTLAGQYLNRFPKSPFADNFLRGFTATTMRLRLEEEVANFPRLESVTAGVRREDRRALFLAIARAALVNGKIAMTDVASDAALTLAEADSADEARARLYQGAVRTLTDQYDAGVAQLQAIDAKKLSKEDLALLAAARIVARRIREKLAASSGAEPPAPAGAKEDSASATIHLAEAALAKAQQPPGGGVP